MRLELSAHYALTVISVKRSGPSWAAVPAAVPWASVRSPGQEEVLLCPGGDLLPPGARGGGSVFPVAASRRRPSQSTRGPHASQTSLCACVKGDRVPFPGQLTRSLWTGLRGTWAPAGVLGSGDCCRPHPGVRPRTSCGPGGDAHLGTHGCVVSARAEGPSQACCGRRSEVCFCSPLGLCAATPWLLGWVGCT